MGARARLFAAAMEEALGSRKSLYALVLFVETLVSAYQPATRGDEGVLWIGAISRQRILDYLPQLASLNQGLFAFSRINEKDRKVQPISYYSPQKYP